MLIALLIPLCLATLLFLILLARSAIQQGAVRSPEAMGLGVDHQLLRYAGHRLVRADHGVAQVPQAGARPPDPVRPCSSASRPPAMPQAIIFLILLGVLVDPVLLFGCALALLLGGLIGAPLVAKARVWIVQLVVAIALLVAAALCDDQPAPVPRRRHGVRPSAALTIVAIAANFGFGMLLNFGVGNYAPTLVMLSLMGMDPRLCFPIMAAGGALRSRRSIAPHIDRRNRPRIVLGLALGGIPAVLRRRLPGQGDAARDAALAGDRRRALCRARDAAAAATGRRKNWTER